LSAKTLYHKKII